jgi:sucrose-6-phosphate hydrolase SacC (GH32 family)
MNANRNIRCIAAFLAACATFATTTARAQEVKPDRLADELVLNFHLIHPGEKNNMAGDPNGCFFLDGRYHLHYLAEAKGGAAYAHVSSPDILHWQWHRTPLTPAFTGFNNASGGKCLSKEGLPVLFFTAGKFTDCEAVVTVAKDRTMEEWEKPWPIKPKHPDGSPVVEWKKPYTFDPKNLGGQRVMRGWDPDIRLFGDTYFAFYGGEDFPLFTSKDLRNWTFKGDFIPRGKSGRYLTHEFPDVAHYEDISCPDFFPLGDKWMLLCISHPFGCRYYIGERNEKGQFIPETHGRMNWRRENTAMNNGHAPLFFAPDSVETADGRRVMWAWIRPGDMVTGGKKNGYPMTREQLVSHAMMSLPRELSLPPDGVLRIKPLRELEGQRRDPVTRKNVKFVTPMFNTVMGGWEKIADLPGESCEIRIVIARKEAEGQYIGFQLFTDENWKGFQIGLRPDSKSIVLGSGMGSDVSAPFDLSTLPPDEDLELRIFVDKFLVEVFVNDRQALVGSHMNWQGKPTLHAFKHSWPASSPLVIKEITTWRIEPTNQGLLKARDNPIWKVER